MSDITFSGVFEREAVVDTQRLPCIPLGGGVQCDGREAALGFWEPLRALGRRHARFRPGSFRATSAGGGRSPARTALRAGPNGVRARSSRAAGSEPRRMPPGAPRTALPLEWRPQGGQGVRSAGRRRRRTAISRSSKCWKTERSETPARSEICLAVGRRWPSSVRVRKASTTASRVRSARAVRPSVDGVARVTMAAEYASCTDNASSFAGEILKIAASGA